MKVSRCGLALLLLAGCQSMQGNLPGAQINPLNPLTVKPDTQPAGIGDSRTLTATISFITPQSSASPLQGSAAGGITAPPQGVAASPQSGQPQASSPPQSVTAPPQGVTAPPQGVTAPPQGITAPPLALNQPLSHEQFNSYDRDRDGYWNKSELATYSHDWQALRQQQSSQNFSTQSLSLDLLGDLDGLLGAYDHDHNQLLDYGEAAAMHSSLGQLLGQTLQTVTSTVAAVTQTVSQVAAPVPVVSTVVDTALAPVQNLLGGGATPVPVVSSAPLVSATPLPVVPSVVPTIAPSVVPTPTPSPSASSGGGLINCLLGTLLSGGCH